MDHSISETDMQEKRDCELGSTQFTPVRHSAISPLLITIITRILKPLTPLLLIVALAGAGLGQFFLISRQNNASATAYYALGITAFLLTLIAQRFATLRDGRTSTTASLESVSKRAKLGWTAAFFMVASLGMVNVAELSGLALLLWMGSLAAALFATAPPEASLSRKFAGLWATIPGRITKGEAIIFTLIVAVGCVLRLYDLEGYPSGIHGDETGFGLIAETILNGRGPNPFGTAFLGDPALYLYIEALFIAFFGHTITALRLFPAISGVVTLFVFYWFMRSLFGVRPALLALALLAGSAVHVNFSRIALNVPQVPLLTCVTLYALWRGQQSRSTFWWFLSGVAGALAIYFHFGGRLVPLMVGLYFLYLLLRWPKKWKVWLNGSAFSLLGGIMALAPMGVHLATRTHLFTDHVSERFILNHWARVSEVHGTDSFIGVVLGQIKINLLAFISGVDASTFYTFTGLPMLSPLLGPLAILGLVLMLTRLPDNRYALLTIWFWTVVVIGGALTIDSPQAHRLMPAVLPAVAGIALILDWTINLCRQLGNPAGEAAMLAAAALIPLTAGYYDNRNYFGPAAEAKPWEPTTLQARYIAALGPEYRAYTLGTPHIYFDHSVTRFMAPNVEGDSIHNPPALLPMPVTADRDLAFLVYPHMEGYLPLLRSIYSEGEIEKVDGKKSQPMFTVFKVPRSNIAAYKGLTAHYGSTSRVESDAHSLGGGASSYPTSASWTGSLYIERPGKYKIVVEGSPATVNLDGIAVEPGQERQLYRGWHQLEIKGELKDAKSRLVLKWGMVDQQPSTVPTKNIDARRLDGHLQCQIVTASGTTIERWDRAIGFRLLSDAWNLHQSATATWAGTLKVEVPGEYRLTLNSDGPAEVRLAERRVIAVPEGTTNLRSASSTAQLSAGSYPIAVRYYAANQPGTLELLWTPPGGQSTIIPPEAFESPHLIQ
ncbi:MAG: glycosyltransferase family 39 protein [Chloroflexota bacterium]|jgi:4-amino-4-deoxy-L-arabinose transferase-like glycosyltransferase